MTYRRHSPFAKEKPAEEYSGGKASATSFREQVARARVFRGSAIDDAVREWMKEETDRLYKGMFKAAFNFNNNVDWSKDPNMVAMQKRLDELAKEHEYSKSSLIGFLNWLNAFVEWTHTLMEFPLNVHRQRLLMEANRPDGEPIAAILFIDETVMDITIREKFHRAVPPGRRSGARFVIESLYPDLRAPGVSPHEL